MKNILVFLFITIGVVFSLNDQTYLTGFANQLGFTQEQITDNIDCFTQVVITIQDFKTTVSTQGLSISDTDIVNWVQRIKLTLMQQCSIFENDLKSYFSHNTLALIFKEALCNNLATYNTQIKQKLVAWASTLDSNQDLEDGKSQAYIYQILFGVVDPTSDPIASFTQTVSGMSMTVPFDGSASLDPDGSIVNYNWDFGDTSSSTNIISGASSSVSHTYSSAGTHTVTLIVTDDSGNTATTTSIVTINALPAPMFTYSTSGSTFTFDAGSSYDSDGTITNYAWNFGESSSSSNTASGTTTSASHTYTTTGTFTVTLTVTDNDGATAIQTQSVRINTPPVASFTQIFSGTTMTFDASASTDSDGSITNYAWTFGEPSSSSNTDSGSSSSASHTYAAIGTYSVTLTVTDNEGATTSITKDIGFNNPPTASFTASISRRVVTFNAGASTDSDGSITNYAWNFGESSSSSNTASGSTASHTYSTAGGAFTVTLTVTDNGGATTTSTKSITIAANSAPTASFTKTVSTGGNQITFTSTSTDSDGSITNYAWNFGDSSSSSNTASSSSAIHVFGTSGTYSVSLTVTDNEGTTKTITTPITVTTVCGSQLHVIAAWDREGDYDLVLALPDGKVIGYWNPGPSADTDYGKLIQDSGNMAVPEEQCWQSPNVPPSGTYLVCVNPYSPNGGLPSTATVTVIINGVATVFTKTETVSSSVQTCTTSSASYVTSFTYP